MLIYLHYEFHDKKGEVIQYYETFFCCILQPAASTDRLLLCLFCRFRRKSGSQIQFNHVCYINQIAKRGGAGGHEPKAVLEGITVRA